MKLRSILLAALAAFPLAVPAFGAHLCVYWCRDGSAGSGLVNSGAECNNLAAQACQTHGGVSMLGLENPPPPPPPFWCDVRCADGTVGGGPANSGEECNALGDQLCAGHGGTTSLGWGINEPDSSFGKAPR